jgi:hypothetical protein
MPSYLIPKPNGRLAIFSTVSNRIVTDDLTDDEYVVAALADAVREAYESARRDLRTARDPAAEREYDYELAREIDGETRREEAAADV